MVYTILRIYLINKFYVCCKCLFHLSYKQLENKKSCTYLVYFTRKKTFYQTINNSIKTRVIFIEARENPQKNMLQQLGGKVPISCEFCHQGQHSCLVIFRRTLILVIISFPNKPHLKLRLINFWEIIRNYFSLKLQHVNDKD